MAARDLRDPPRFVHRTRASSCRDAQASASVAPSGAAGVPPQLARCNARRARQTKKPYTAPMMIAVLHVGASVRTNSPDPRTTLPHASLTVCRVVDRRRLRATARPKTAPATARKTIGTGTRAEDERESHACPGGSHCTGPGEGGGRKSLPRGAPGKAVERRVRSERTQVRLALAGAVGCVVAHGLKLSTSTDCDKQPIPTSTSRSTLTQRQSRVPPQRGREVDTCAVPARTRCQSVSERRTRRKR